VTDLDGITYDSSIQKDENQIHLVRVLQFYDTKVSAFFPYEYSCQ